MTAAHLPGAILTPRCRGARAVAIQHAAFLAEFEGSDQLADLLEEVRREEL